jgi:sulfur carrier protein
MNIRVNDQPREVAADTALAELASGLGLGERKGVAIAVNDEVVPRAAWAGRRLVEGDRVLVIQATQGG